MVTNNHGIENHWPDIIWEYQALFDPEAALTKFNSSIYLPEDGESRTHTLNWINNLVNLNYM